MVTMTSSAVMASAIGTSSRPAALPASTRMRRISSVAYATDDRASEEKTASAMRLLRRSCRACASGIGGPTSRRFSKVTRMDPTSMLRRAAADASMGRDFLWNFYGAHRCLDDGLSPRVTQSRQRSLDGDVPSQRLRSIGLAARASALGVALRRDAASAGGTGGRRGGQPAVPGARAPALDAGAGHVRRHGALAARQPRRLRPSGLVRLRPADDDDPPDRLTPAGRRAVALRAAPVLGRGACRACMIALRTAW